MTTPLISVIIPLFNGTKTISRALDSVFIQTMQEFEVIVIDDGSTDDVEGALQPFKDRIIFQRQNNMGAAAARNHGARLASGEYLAFLDADDFWHAQKLELQIKALKSHHGSSFCATQCRKLNSDDLDHEAYWNLPIEFKASEITDFSTVFTNPYFGTPGILMPTQVFKRCGGFKENLKTAEDVDLWLRAAYKSSVSYIYNPLFYIVGTPDSLTTAHLDRTYADNIKVIDLFCREHPAFANEYPAAVKTARARIYEDWGSAALTRRDKEVARDKLLSSLRYKIAPRPLYLLAKTYLP